MRHMPDQPAAAPPADADRDPSEPNVEPAPPPAWLPDDPAFEERVRHAFIADGRLRSIPARERKKLVIYRYLVDHVLPDPDEIVHERELNMRIGRWHPDPATIRRAFVDLGFVSRDGMAYRRVVGSIRPRSPSRRR